MLRARDVGSWVFFRSKKAAQGCNSSKKKCPAGICSSSIENACVETAMSKTATSMSFLPFQKVAFLQSEPVS